MSPLHRLWRTLPQGPRRRAALAVLRSLAPRPRQPGPRAGAGAIVAGELGLGSGLGMHARLDLAALQASGEAAWALDIPMPSGGFRDGRQDIREFPPDAPLLLHVNGPMVPYALLRLPRALVRNRRIAGTWAWELPQVPKAWRVGVPFVHEVWSPSTFTANAMRAFLPASIPVRVVPIPVAVTPPVPSAIDRAGFGLPADAVVTLCSFNLASSLVRKNPLATIAAHRAAFGDRADRILVLKIGNPEHFPADMEIIRAAVAGAANIRIETRMLPDADTHALTACADIVISLHRSEGFGLVPAEAMLLGRAVVATGWSGNMDYMDEHSAALVTPRLVPAVDPRGVFDAPGAVWADPDPLQAAEHLRRLADDPEARVALGGRARVRATASLGYGPLREAMAAMR